MVKRIHGMTPGEQVVDMLKSERRTRGAGSTSAPGVTVLGDGEDILWGRSDGREISVREVDEALEAAEGRIEEATAELAETQVRLEDAERTVAETDLKLTELGETTLPAVQAELEAVAEEAARELGILDEKLVTAQQELDTAKGGLTQLEAELAAEAGVREQLAQEVQGDLQELDTRLGAFATDEALAPIRQALTDAATAVETAQGVADAANQAANAASQAALEAAGIAASKGRVIIQATEPTGDDRQAANIWIKPAVDDPATEVKETATTYVYLADTDEWMPTTSDELAQAAQNALDAREAAQQAQQRADTAISNAATAQAAAEAAQRTADTATTDARDAWNEAVAAQAAADAAQSQIAYGLNLVDDPSISKSSAYWSTSNGTSTTIEDRDMGRGVVTALKHVSAGHTTIYSPYFPIDPMMAYEYRITFDKPVVDLGGSSDFYFGISAVSPSGAGTPVDGIYQSNGAYGSTNTNFYFWNGVGPFDGPREIVGYVLPLGTDNSIAQGLGNASLVARLAGDADRLRVRFLNYANVDQELALYASNISVRAVTVEDLIRARDARVAAKAAQDAADAASALAEEAKGLAQDAVREVGDTVRDTKIEYAVNTSETVAPTTGWSLSTPTRTAGSFIWMRTIVTYADGDTSTTSPALLTGNAGATGAKGSTGATGPKGDRGTDGVAGKDGVGLSSTALAYALSTSGTTAPTTGWTAAVPTPIKGRYLWTRTTWTYTDASTEVGYSVAYLATDGAKGNDGIAGKDGVGIKSTAITYASSSSGTTAPSTGWASQPPAAAAGQFVWTRTVWTYTDNSTETGYSVGKIGDTGSTGAKGATGSTGAKGDTGAQGVSVSSVSPFFRTVARTAGAPAQPSGMTPSGWSATEPAWSSSTKLYRAERVVYSNGTVSWTVPTLVAAYEGIVQVQTSVNGKNSITRSTSNASGSGVVAGDAWYKVDSNGDTMAMWIWSGSAWVASKVRNEMIDTIDVNKLKVHNSLEVVGDAVIEKLWADGISTRTLNASRITVAPGNVYRDPMLIDPAGWSKNYYYPTGGYGGGGSFLIPASTTQSGGYDTLANAYVSTRVRGGTAYRFSFWFRSNLAVTARNRVVMFRRYYDESGAQVGGTSACAEADPAPANTWTLAAGEETAPDGAVSIAIGFYTQPGHNSAVRFSDPGVVPKVGAVLIEDGAITADKIKADEVGAAVGKFVKAEVGNLVATTGTIGEAVINKVWADGIAAKAITAARVAVAPGNLIPGIAEIGAGKRPDPDPFPGWTLNAGGYLYTVGPTTINIEAPISVEAGRKYKLTFDVNASVANTRYYVQVMGANADGSSGGANPGIEGTTSTYIATNALVGAANTWHTQEFEWTPASSGYAILRFYTNHTNGASTASTFQRFRRFSLMPMVGAVLIENGAVKAEHITATGTMSANIVKAMTVATKKLVVTQETILNHATLIGKTVVDDINVQGKLIGTNGVFKGTVDFANINVTGTAILNKIGANSISADKIAGGSFTGKSFAGGTFSGSSFIGGDYATTSRPATDGGVMLDPANGIRVWPTSGGSPTFQVRPSDGYVKASGYIYSSDLASNSGTILVPSTSAGTGGIWFSSNGTAGRDEAAIYRSNFSTARDQLILRGGNGGGISVFGDNSIFAGRVEVENLAVLDLWHNNMPTVTSGSANVVIASSPYGRFYKTGSSRRYKRNIADWNPEAERVLALRPRQWQDKEGNDPEAIREAWGVGFIAEEVHDLGLGRLVQYVGDGAGGWVPDSLNYDRFAAAQQIVLRKHEDEINELRERIALLESK